jgi:mono/diheme cytochrome c family protein
MRRTFTFLSVVLLAGFGAAVAQTQDTKDKGKTTQTADQPTPIPQQDADKKNPVKPSTDGMAEAKKLYGYHCAMCHGKDGDGKGELAEQMKLQLNDWRDPATISKYTDGALFYIVTNGRGKMVGGEGEGVKPELRWNLVNLVRSFGKKADQTAKQP